MKGVSVVIPTYNREKFLTATINSVLKQTVPVLEILVCDDGSMDHSRQVIKKIGSTKVHWIAGSHTGLPAVARNRGIERSKGELIAFLDSDDTWLPEKMARQLPFFDDPKVLGVSANALRMVKTIESGRVIVGNNSNLSVASLLFQNSVICSSMVVRRSALEATGDFSEKNSLRGFEDYALWLRVAALFPISFVAEPLVRYRDEFQDSLRYESERDVVKQKLEVLKNFLPWLIYHFPLIISYHMQ